MMGIRDNVVLLVGGVGGAKLAYGLAHILPPGALTIIVNTGDDFEHFGLHISPDIDTVMYTLAGLANPITGWGIDGDTFQAMEMVERYGGPTWFQLGDLDLGTHLQRTKWLQACHSLTEVTRRLCAALAVPHTILPMCDQPVRTRLITDQGQLDFQDYFVRLRWEPHVHRIAYEGAERAYPSEAVAQALESATVIVLGPSNPVLSIDPILAVPGIRKRIVAHSAFCAAVSPIIGSQAVKGPAAKLLAELGIEVSPLGVAQYYANLLNGIILDEVDRELRPDIESMGLLAAARHTLMTTSDDKKKLAEELLTWIENVTS
jgi:LPPG:FO 2-phospho-L-lactate transferase